jgi:hypothetical protein
MRKTVLALATFGAIGAACSFAFAGRRPFPRPGPITPRSKRRPAADLARVAHGDGLGSAVLMAAGALLAAAAIGGAPGATSRLSGSLVSRCRAEGLLIATASASACADFRLGHN